MTPSLSIIVPVYNEEKTLPLLLDRVLAIAGTLPHYEIVVINDGSTDTTPQILTLYSDRVLVLTHPKNRGKGAAVCTGIRQAHGEYVVIQDGDLEYDPHDLLRMFALAKEQNLPVVYGSRRLPLPGEKEHRGAWYYYLGGLLVTFCTNMLYGTHLTDEPTCYKMIRSDILKHLSLNAEGFEFCPEVTAKITRLGVPIVEIPIHYAPRSEIEGKKIRPKDGIIAIATLLRYRFWKPKDHTEQV